MPLSSPRAGPIGPELLVPSPHSRALIPYLEDYFRLLTMLEAPPGRFDPVDVDWSVVREHWGGGVQLGLNVPRFPGGLAGVWVADGEGSVGASIYEDMTRFSLEDVERSLGCGQKFLLEFSDDVTPALRELLQ